MEKYGANLSASDSDGRTPLHVAAGEGRLSAWPVVEFLLGRGASDSVHSRDRIENTPLMSDVSGDHQEVVRVDYCLNFTVGLFFTYFFCLI